MIKTTEKSLLLKGVDGLQMLDDAFDLAKRVLNVEHLDVHPDYLFIERQKRIGVDDVLPIVNKASLMPSLADHCVCIIDGIDAFTEAAQNKMLKILEESSMQVIAISYSDRVLETIKSRLIPVSYMPMPYEEFKGYVDGEDVETLYMMTRGAIGLVEQCKEVVDMFTNVKECVLKHELKGLMPALHIVNEKDKLSIYKSGYMPMMVEFIEYVFSELFIASVTGKDTSLIRYSSKYSIEVIKEICSITSEHKENCRKQWYTKDNFFYLIASITMIGGK